MANNFIAATPARRAMQLALLMFLSTTLGLPARAQERGKVIEEVTVTGSRIARTDLESTVPIVTVSPDEIAGTGNTSVGDLLNELPAIRSTFSQSNSSRFLGTTGLNLLDLRGLGTQRTLVLVNGRRHVGSDILSNAVTPDINTIPTDLIEGIDVVTGGKSAVYGSDAIAGVVNFRLLKNFEGLRFRGQAGQSSRADGDDYFGSALYGTNFWEDRGNAVFNLEFANQKAFFASDRDNLKRNGGFVVVDADPASAVNGSDGIPDRRFVSDIRSATIANGGNILFTPRANSGLAPCGVGGNGVAFRCSYIFQPDGTLVKQTGNRIGLGPNGSFEGGNGSNNRERNALAIFPDLRRVNFNVLSNIKISDALEPFLEAKFIRTDSLRFGQPAFFQGGTIGGNVDLREQPRFDNPFLSDANRATINGALAEAGLNPAGPDTRFALQRNLLDLGPRQEDAKRETTRFVLGVGGAFANVWSYEVAANYGKFKEDTEVLGNLDQQRFLLAMDSTRDASGNIVCRSQVDQAAAIPFDPSNPLGVARLQNDVATCVPLNPFGDGSITRAMRNYLLQNTTSVAEIEQQVYSASVSGDTSNWFSLPAGPIGLAFGLERRTEKNFFKADDLVESGLTFYNALPLFDPPQFSVNEAFAETRIPLLRDLPGARELSVSGAIRYADYKGPTGTVNAYDTGVDYAPIDGLRFRAGVARAVRAPNLADRFSAQSQNFAGNINDPCSARNVGTGSPNRAANCAAAGIPSSYDFVYTSSLQILSGGNPNLKEETSDSVTLGVVFQPKFVPGFTFTADYYEITIDDVITAPEAQAILDACYDAGSLNNQFCSLFQRAGAGGAATGEEAFRVIEGSLQQTSLNYAKSKARGIDFQLVYNRNDVPYLDNLGARLLYTRALQRDEFLDPVNPNLPDRILQELGDPKDVFNLNVDVARGPLSVGYQMRFIGKQLLMFNEDTNSVGGNPPQNADFADRRFYPSVFYHDLRVGYDINQTWNAYLGVDNLTDKEPPLGLAPNTGGVPGEGGSGIYDFRGRFFFGGLKATF